MLRTMTCLEQREVVLAAITRGYQVMAVEKEMMAEMCGNLRQEQQVRSSLIIRSMMILRIGISTGNCRVVGHYSIRYRCFGSDVLRFSTG